MSVIDSVHNLTLHTHYVHIQLEHNEKHEPLLEKGTLDILNVNSSATTTMEVLNVVSSIDLHDLHELCSNSLQQCV